MHLEYLVVYFYIVNCEEYGHMKFGCTCVFVVHITMLKTNLEL